MDTVEAIDGEVRLTTTWGGVRRYVFISRDRIKADAGEDMSRNAAVAYVVKHLAKYRDEAEAQHGSDNLIQMVELASAR